jgi:hypothetical protein
VIQEPSPVPSDRPWTPEETQHIERLMAYIFKTESGRCVTVLDEETAVTYAHGSHRTWIVGDTVPTDSICIKRARTLYSNTRIMDFRDLNVILSRAMHQDQVL